MYFLPTRTNDKDVKIVIRCDVLKNLMIDSQWKWLNIEVYWSEISLTVKMKNVTNFLSIKCTSTDEDDSGALVWENTLALRMF